jgi:hypothetical protein
MANKNPKRFRGQNGENNVKDNPNQNPNADSSNEPFLYKGGGTQIDVQTLSTAGYWNVMNPGLYMLPLLVILLYAIWGFCAKGVSGALTGAGTGSFLMLAALFWIIFTK